MCSPTLQLDVATSGRGGITPFVGVCIIAAAFGVADGHVQGGMTGDLSLMCPEFIQVNLSPWMHRQIAMVFLPSNLAH